MRVVLVIGILGGCTETEVTRKKQPDDPRFDPSDWPQVVGGDRPADVRAPASWDGERLLPVVVVLHGYGANGMAQDLYFQATPRVEEEQMIVLLPDGTQEGGSGARFWNASPTCCDFLESGVDDVGYLSGLLDDVEAAFPVDVDRITLLGHSNGGFMAYRMACEVGDRLAGIASLAGLAQPDACTDAPGTPSVLQIHGTEDDTIPYETSWYGPGARESVLRWTDRAGCGQSIEAAPSDWVVDIAGDDTRRERWTDGCSGTFEAALWSVDGGSHIPAFDPVFRDELYRWLLERSR